MALATAEAVSFIDGLRMVSKRGQIMSQVSGGGMAAVIGLDIDKIESTIEGSGCDQVDLANFNSPGQIVLSGPSSEIQAILSPLKEAGARMVVPLKVSGAFHSRMMEGPATEFEGFLKNFSHSLRPDFQSIQMWKQSHTMMEIQSHLFSFAKFIVLSFGVKLFPTSRRPAMRSLLECGPGNVLTKLLRQILEQI